MAEGRGCHERPDVETQKSELGALMRTTLQRGAQWYLIDSRWFKQWKKYVGFDSWDMYNVGEHNLFPGPIDNSGLFSDPESQTLKEHLIDELDYVLVPTEAWNKLLNWYGCVEGQQPIVRKGIMIVSDVHLVCYSEWPSNIRAAQWDVSNGAMRAFSGRL
ncbi:ubiquitin carboxyl-terminal hydrolase 4 isoform X4 [Marmota monax]|uniref:ubiquitin carboxyl-terminal hydrolase 4 isoform X4 n=1 Tax=Marmota monax TaxID=9995 RepID=UPI001EAFFDAC|nr:ubiquitin carboxyl-terminal hydrolase 4 isoform X4 [Marmota monax]XP_046287506.1 ubiquitin carboxyl-terminal hydrolase 4 isoform X4 [Marmota monax]